METIVSPAGKSATELMSPLQNECLNEVKVSEHFNETPCLNEKHQNKKLSIKCIDDLNFVTEEEIAASLNKKEENDSLSLTGSCISQPISQISTITRGSCFDDLSLNTLRMRKNELINSIRNHLNTSNESDADNTDLNDTSISSSTITEKKNDQNLSASTPLRQNVPLAAKFLKEWKPTFLNNNLQEMANENIENDIPNGNAKSLQYEKAFASLSEILTNPTTDMILDLYTSKLDAYKEEDDKKFDEMISLMDCDKKSLFSIELDTIEDLDKTFTEPFEDTLLDTNETVIDLISYDNTVICPLKEEQSDSVQLSVVEKPKPCPSNGVSAIVISDEESVTNIADEKRSQEPVGPALEEKDPENLIIGEDDDTQAEFVDEDLLLASDDEQHNEAAVPKNIAAAPIKDLEIFISNDPEENKDNNDPTWENLRNLGSKHERYKAVQARWKNLEIPNPKKDLTCRCHRVMRNGKTPVNESYNYRNKFGKRPHSPEINRRYSKKPRRESCTLLFDMSIKQLMSDMEQQRRQIEREQKESLNHLADIQQMEQIIAQRERRNDVYIRQMKRRQFVDTENLIKDFRRKLDELMGSARRKIDALRNAGDEVRQFHEFYPNLNADGNNDKNSLLYLTETEVQEILEVENMFIRFESFYSTPAT